MPGSGMCRSRFLIRLKQLLFFKDSGVIAF